MAKNIVLAGKTYTIPDKYDQTTFTDNTGSGIGGVICKGEKLSGDPVYAIDDSWTVVGGVGQDYNHTDSRWSYWVTALAYKWVENNNGTYDCKFYCWTANSSFSGQGKVKLQLGNNYQDNSRSSILYQSGSGEYNDGLKISGGKAYQPGDNNTAALSPDQACWSFLNTYDQNDPRHEEVEKILKGETFSIVASGYIWLSDTDYSLDHGASVVFQIPAYEGNFVHIYSQVSGESNPSWHKYRPWIYNGTTWQKAKPFVYDTNQWKRCR